MISFLSVFLNFQDKKDKQENKKVKYILSHNFKQIQLPGNEHNMLYLMIFCCFDLREKSLKRRKRKPGMFLYSPAGFSQSNSQGFPIGLSTIYEKKHLMHIVNLNKQFCVY